MSTTSTDQSTHCLTTPTSVPVRKNLMTRVEVCDVISKTDSLTVVTTGRARDNARSPVNHCQVL